MNMTRNCPNCGAPIGLDDKCGYCGTLFIDISNIPLDKVFYMKLRLGSLYQNRVIVGKVICNNISYETSIDEVPSFNLEFHLVGDVKSIGEEKKT